MGDLSVSQQFLERWMKTVDQHVADAAASPATRPLDPDTADGDVRAAIGKLSERSHQTEQKIEQMRAMLILLQRGMTELLVARAGAESIDGQTEKRLERLDTEAQERDGRLNKLEAWRYGMRLSWAALTAAAGAAAAAVTIGIEFLRH
jgi:uncharacterized protein YceH (UPF0502 family)